MGVAGIGQCSLDYLAEVDAYPAADTKQEVLAWTEQGGGPVATALVALARLGIPCTFHGIVGDDEAGEKIRRSLVVEGVDVAGLRVRPEATSQIAFIAVERSSARRTIFWKRPSGSPLLPEELGRSFLDRAEALLLDGLMHEVSSYAAAEARARGIPVMLDAGRNRPGMYDLARLCDVVVASGEFARDLSWRLTPSAIASERERLGIDVLTVTIGEEGSITASENGAFHLPAFRVAAVDTTGAGDVFHGGYLYGLLRGWDLKETVTFASALAAMKCTATGGRAGIPRLDAVMSFIASRRSV